MRTILYTNTKSKKCIWECETHRYESENEHDYSVMANTHIMIDSQKDCDMVEGIRLLLKTNGTLIKI